MENEIDQAAMDKQAEYVARVMDEIYVPAFIKSCADHGVGFQTEDHLRKALETTAKIEAIEAAQAVDADPIDKAAAAIDELVGGIPQLGVASEPKQLSPEAVEALAALA